MKKGFLTFLSLLSLIGAGEVDAQSTWTAPSVGMDIATVADGTTAYYMYNTQSDVFMTYGYTWNTRAFAAGLWNNTDPGQQVYVSADGDYYKFSIVALTTSKNIFYAGSATTIYADNTTNASWALTAASATNSYKFQNTANTARVTWFPRPTEEVILPSRRQPPTTSGPLSLRHRS